MPTRTTSTGGDGAAGTYSTASNTKHFELPILDLNFGSLTQGTDIPPPDPSPDREVPTPPKTPVENAVDEEKPEANGVALNGHHETSPQSDITSSTNEGGLKRPAEDVPASPTHSSRGSLRRLLSRTLLNNTYDEQASVGGQAVSRPPSRTASTIAEDKKSKRGSGWFRRLRSNDKSNAPVAAPSTAPGALPNKRHSTHLTQFEEFKKPTGPPPPMIPELSTWEYKPDITMGDDIFKDIK
ncbi:uncharacterized protein BCR38DRAFT_483255 [Pseudomassariella vexata]|uniref:Uncharacterized protein n=1 Tax=Pseudomassariella vexata TaxID=1141098 RepID=A0A1Y2E7W1_9PEZI|nr:uncharacterized protein BCR38DRAFT_483255 [Pseudomassariella vexata]ORY67640.1 hypothetical protein BCR38DRAFT_483255 [Pseudomassariella vexata]